MAIENIGIKLNLTLLWNCRRVFHVLLPSLKTFFPVFFKAQDHVWEKYSVTSACAITEPEQPWQDRSSGLLQTETAALGARVRLQGEHGTGCSGCGASGRLVQLCSSCCTRGQSSEYAAEAVVSPVGLNAFLFLNVWTVFVCGLNYTHGLSWAQFRCPQLYPRIKLVFLFLNNRKEQA